MTRRTLLQRISIVSNRKHPAVVAGLVPTTPSVRAQDQAESRWPQARPTRERWRMIQYDREAPSWSDFETRILSINRILRSLRSGRLEGRPQQMVSAAILRHAALRTAPWDEVEVLILSARPG